MVSVGSVFWAVLWLGNALAQTPIASSDDASFVNQERVGGELGVGMGLGAPTGVVAKYWLGDWTAVQAGFGGDLGEHRSLSLTVDYVVSFRPMEVPDALFSLPIYMGAGLKVDANLQATSAVALGPRWVVGASLVVPDLPLDLYIEVVPTFYLMELPAFSPSLAMDGQIGIHYYL